MAKIRQILALSKSQLIAVWRLLGDELALSVIACAMPPLPKGEAFASRKVCPFCPRLSHRESPWQAGPLPTGRPRPDMTQKGGPCYRGQQLRDNIPCQAVVNLDSGALLFPRHRALLVQAKSDRYANGSPYGRAGERSETERASPSPESRRTAISRFFGRAKI